MSTSSTILFSYPGRTDVEIALNELQHAGFDLKTLAICKDYHIEEHVIGYYSVRDRMKYWGRLGAFWGGLWGLLFGSAFFLLPSIGSLVVAEPLVQTIVSGVEGAIIFAGMGTLGAGLYGVRIPENSVFRYETALKIDPFLLVVHGSDEEVVRAKRVLEATIPARIDRCATA